MEELIATFLLVCSEVFIEILGSIGTWPSSGRTPWQSLGSTGWFCVGLVVGLIWATMFPHFMLPTPELRLANLVLSPLLSAYVGQFVSTRRRRENFDISPRNHFWYAYWFTLGLIVARYGYTYRSILETP